MEWLREGHGEAAQSNLGEWANLFNRQQNLGQWTTQISNNLCAMIVLKGAVSFEQ